MTKTHPYLDRLTGQAQFRSPRSSLNANRARVVTAVSAIAVFAGLPMSLPAQVVSAGGARVIAPPIAPQDITGKDFAGLTLAGGVQNTDVSIKAARAWAWSEGGLAGEVGEGGVIASTQRLFLQGDVQITAGRYRFTAANAVVWVQVLGPSKATPGAGGVVDNERRVRQIAIQFDRVADPGAEAGFAQAADRLLVTVLADGLLSLKSDALAPGKPSGNPAQNGFLAESEERLARFLRGIVDPGADLGADPTPKFVLPRRQQTIVPGLSRPYEPNAGFARKDVEAPEPPAAPTIDPIFAKSGIVTFAVGTTSPTGATAPRFGDTDIEQENVKLIRGEEDNSVILTGGVALQYSDSRKTQNLQISAERAVVFLKPGPLSQLAQFSADTIRGVYLEGDVVATDGQYTLRGPKVYYDFVSNTAAMVDAVFTTFEPSLGVPVYVRAKSIKQLAANQFQAQGARLSTSSFFTPVFSIGVSDVTITQTKVQESSGKTTRKTVMDASGITPRFLNVPVLWFPGFKGELDEPPITDLRVENSSGSGAALKTGWNVFGLLGVDRPSGVRSTLLLDYYFDRGFAAGTKTTWKSDGLDGRLFAYGLFEDTGRDILSTGARREQDQEFRGLLLAENRWEINDHWTLFGELALQSDATVVDSFFKDVAREGRELTSQLALRRLDDSSVFTLQLKGNLNRYVPNQYLLQSQGFVVDRLPEATYVRSADDVLPGVTPGLLTWTHEYRVGRIRLNLNEPRVGDFGFDTIGRSQAAFGINPNQSLADRLRAAGFTEEDVLRYDTRQELTATIDLDPVKLTPFVAGRFTGYDQEIGNFYGASGDPTDKNRFWYSAGVRASTQLTRVDDSVESSLFDLHRIRHIIEPNVTAWSSASSINQESIPVYDEPIESLSTGTAVRTGVTQTWQTQRGGPGRWRSVDVLKLSTDVTFATSDRNELSPIKRTFDSRPEYSFLGNFFTGDVQWQMTDAIAFAANTIFDFDINQQARTTIGGTIQHLPEFSTFGQLRYINALNVTYVDFGGSYQLTRLYSFGAGATYDTDRDEVQRVNAQLRRRLPDSTIGLSLDYNTIIEETSFSVIFEPLAANSVRQAQQVQRLREIGR